MTKGNDSVQLDLVEIGRFQFQHELDTALADGVGLVHQLLVVGLSAELSLDEVLAVLDEILP